MGKLEGRVAIVTGGGRGIGKATAERFAAEGAKVVVATRTAAPGEETVNAIRAAGGEATLAAIDVGDRESVRKLVADTAARYGRIDIIVHNAAFIPAGPLQKVPDSAFDKMLDVGLKAAFWLTADALPYLEASPAGRIMVTSSGAGNRKSIAGMVHYGALKMAVTGFVRGAALELAPRGITVNAIEPGLTDTYSLHASMTDDQIAATASRIPINRPGKPEEIAAGFLFLASDEAGYMTGQSFSIDGGSSLGDATPLPMDRLKG